MIKKIEKKIKKKMKKFNKKTNKKFSKKLIKRVMITAYFQPWRNLMYVTKETKINNSEREKPAIRKPCFQKSLLE